MLTYTISEENVRYLNSKCIRLITSSVFSYVETHLASNSPEQTKEQMELGMEPRSPDASDAFPSAVWLTGKATERQTNPSRSE